MNHSPTDQPQDQPAARRTGWPALVLALLALALTCAQWMGLVGRPAAERNPAEERARTERRVRALEDRIQREHEELVRLTQRIGTDNAGEDSLTGRVQRLEETTAKLPGGSRARLLWLLEQAEYFMRVANAQESLAGDSAGALTALGIADQHLRDAADPRFTPVRKLLAAEITSLRAVPRVDTEGLVLKLAALGETLEKLPPRQTAPPSFNPAPPEPPVAPGGFGRAAEALRAAFFRIVSVRRTDVPAMTLLSDESAALLERSLELELQMARLALIRGDAPIFHTSLAAVRRNLVRYFDASAPPVAGALGVVDDLARAPLPEALPDVSGSLKELLRIKEHEFKS